MTFVWLAAWARPALATMAGDCPMHMAMEQAGGMGHFPDDPAPELSVSESSSLDITLIRPIPETSHDQLKRSMSQMVCPHMMDSATTGETKIICKDCCCCVRSAPQHGSLGGGAVADAVFFQGDGLWILTSGYVTPINHDWPPSTAHIALDPPPPNR
ncbi:MAG: hypothetical protein OEY50_11685 [Nitrospinota bacterium]|nr:hypothetical protein [Nitrospinota bacterium]